jgi:8-oxo-dGTP pyrophosphatase MutT (NUDIX family)
MSESHSRNKDMYNIAVKLLLRDGDKLLITHDIFKSWDIPGGRIKKDEFEAPLESVIRRKMNEELGSEVEYEISEPVVFFRVKRIEYSTKEEARIFAIGYSAKYLRGDIKLGQNHDRFEWVDVNTFKPEDYFTGGWLTGVQEYIKKNLG